MEICKEIRTFSMVPIIMVTARIEEIDRLLGVELGADDYICKPFSPREVVARVKAVLRRTASEPPGAPPPLQLDEERLLATLNGTELELTVVEFKLVGFLGQPLDNIRPDPAHGSDLPRSTDGQRSNHRQPHKEPAQEDCRGVAGKRIIHSVYGVGYKYDE